jgi:flagellar protein FliS
MYPTMLASPPSAPHDRRAALAGYRTVSLEARVAAASPHTLVLMLYERLAAQLREADAAGAAGQAARRLRAVERSLAIVDSLDSSLDHRRGGKTARSLHDVYALIRDRLLAGERLEDAVAAADMLRDSWRQIAPAG